MFSLIRAKRARNTWVCDGCPPLTSRDLAHMQKVGWQVSQYVTIAFVSSPGTTVAVMYTRSDVAALEGESRA